MRRENALRGSVNSVNGLRSGALLTLGNGRVFVFRARAASRKKNRAQLQEDLWHLALSFCAFPHPHPREIMFGACSVLPGISEESKVEAPAFTDAVRMYRQSKEQYGTWDMLCGNEAQVSPGQEGNR